MITIGLPTLPPEPTVSRSRDLAYGHYAGPDGPNDGVVQEEQA